MDQQGDLGALANPKAFQTPIDLRNQPRERLIAQLDMMLTIREAEMAIAAMVEAGDTKCPCHLAVGQEAVSVGVAAHLRASDRGYGNHRSHGHYLAAAGSLDELFAEILGRATGCSRGMGGSMHLFTKDTFFRGSVPIVAGTVPVAVGAGLAAKMDGKGDVAIAFFGDGACEEGVVHESMNIAASMTLPVLFVVENNLFSSHLDIHLRQPSNSVARFAEAHRIASATVDGNDVVAVATAAEMLIAGARAGKGPGFLEAVTYRWLGHVGPDANIDVGVRRSAEELAEWKRRDPVRRLADALIADGALDVAGFAALEQQVKHKVAASRARAYDAPWPEPSALLDLVYAETSR